MLVKPQAPVIAALVATLTPLTAGAERVSSWDLSGDGEHIVFASEAQAGSNIHILELATNGVTTLEVSGRLPRWLP
jgi:hypothetical protein